MKERPILFKGEMVRAILEGRKTMTRRIVNPQPWHSTLGYYPGSEQSAKEGYPADLWYPCDDPHNSGGRYPCDDGVKCPYGRPGDRLWVKEATYHPLTGQSHVMQVNEGLIYAANRPSTPDHYKKVPSLFMPRWASRITLEIVSVKVERLNDITGEDAIREGVLCSAWSEEDWVDSDGYLTPYAKRHEQAVEEFSELWDSINGKTPGASWEANPWVWVIEFKRVKP